MPGGIYVTVCVASVWPTQTSACVHACAMHAGTRCLAVALGRDGPSLEPPIRWSSAVASLSATSHPHLDMSTSVAKAQSSSRMSIFWRFLPFCLFSRCKHRALSRTSRSRQSYMKLEGIKPLRWKYILVLSVGHIKSATSIDGAICFNICKQQCDLPRPEPPTNRCLRCSFIDVGSNA